MGILGLNSDTVTLINRCNQDLSGMWDGQSRLFKANSKTHGIPREAAGIILGQHPVMGSEDFYDPTSFDSLFGIEGETNCDPLEVVHAPQRVDLGPQKARLHGSKQVIQVIPARGASVFDARADTGVGHVSVMAERPVAQG